jgi:hypothetical protein
LNLSQLETAEGFTTPEEVEKVSPCTKKFAEVPEEYDGWPKQMKQ